MKSIIILFYILMACQNQHDNIKSRRPNISPSRETSDNNIEQKIEWKGVDNIKFILKNSLINDSIDEFTPLITESKIEIYKEDKLVSVYLLNIQKSKLPTVSGDTVLILFPFPTSIEKVIRDNSKFFVIHTFGGGVTYYHVFKENGEEMGYKYFIENDKGGIISDKGHVDDFYGHQEKVTIVKKVTLPIQDNLTIDW